MDQQLQKDIWDARVKIVIGRFVINTFQFAVGFTILLFITIRSVFDIPWEQSDAWIMSMWLRFGLPGAGIILVIGYLVNYRPKKAKIDLYKEHVTLYYQKFAESHVPSTARILRCFTFGKKYELKSDVAYHVWSEAGNKCFFPVKPEIETLESYITKGIPYVTVKIPEADIIKAFFTDPISYTAYSYNQSKKLITTTKTAKTLSLQIKEDNQSFFTYVFEQGIDYFLKSEIIELKIPQKAQAPIQDPIDNMKSRLEKLKKMLDDGLITENEYQDQRKKILDQMT